MKIVNKRIHGRLLMVTGIVHILLVIFPGVFGEQFYEFAKDLFFNINDGLLDFPLFGGTIKNQDFAAFWFFYAGPLMFMYGHLLDSYEKKNIQIEKSIVVIFIVISSIGAYMIPLSGMTFLLLPQGIYMYIRSNKLAKTANKYEEAELRRYTHKDNMKNPNREIVSKLEALPNLGKVISADLRLIGIIEPQNLIGKNPFDLYNELCIKKGKNVDYCVIDVFMSVVDFMEGEEPKHWWKFTQKRKEILKKEK